jgi:molecular chaperone DnaK
LLLDVTPLSLGIETLGGVFTKLIESNTTIPMKKSETFSTAAENQPSVEINVLQGERPMAKDNKNLGRFILDGIPSAPRGVPQIEVTFDIDANGIIQVSASDKGTGKKQNIRIEAGSGLSKEEIEKMKNDAKMNEESDKKLREEIEKINMADSQIFNSEKQLKDYGDKIPADKKTVIEDALATLKTAHGAKDIAGIDASLEALNAAWQAASEELYKAMNDQPGQGGAGAQASADNNNTDDVQDAEIVEETK